jgi:uncharacterized protein YbjT (DUF2867 family)
MPLLMLRRGLLGSNTLDALVSKPFATHFDTITAMGQDSLADDRLKYLRDQAASSNATFKFQQVDYNNVSSLEQALQDVQFLINMNNFPASETDSHHNKENILEAANTAGVEVYLPSEFGCDWRTNDFQQVSQSNPVATLQ